MARVAGLLNPWGAPVARAASEAPRSSLARGDIFAGVLIGAAVACLSQAVLHLAELPTLPGELFLLALLAAPLGALTALSVGVHLGRFWAPAPSAAKFLLVGSLNTLIDFSLFNLLLRLFGIPPGLLLALCKAAAFALAVVNSYLWNKHWCFRRSLSEAVHHRVVAGKEFSLFVGVTLVGLSLNAAVTTALVERVHPWGGLSALHWANVAAGVGLTVSTVWDFSLYRLLVFAGGSQPTSLGTRISRLRRLLLPCQRWWNRES